MSRGTEVFPTKKTQKRMIKRKRRSYYLSAVARQHFELQNAGVGVPS